MQTTVPAALQVQQWSNKYFLRYIRATRFVRYYSMEGNNVIYINKELGKKPGTTITIGEFADLTDDPIYDDDTLTGNEEDQGSLGDSNTVRQLRKAVKIGHYEQKKSHYDYLKIAGPRLRKWSASFLRDQIVDALQTVNLDGVTTYAASTQTQRDAAVTANGAAALTTSRFCFGELLGNETADDHSASLGAIDVTNDTLDTGMLGIMRRLGTDASPAITPLTVSEDEEWWVLFCGTEPKRDLKADMDTIHQNSAPRSLRDNPLYREGDLVHGAVIIREIPEMNTLGNDGLTAAPIYSLPFCGQNAVWVAWAEMPTPIRNGRDGEDFGNLRAIGIREMRGVKQIIFDNIFNGVIHGYCTAAADA